MTVSTVLADAIMSGKFDQQLDGLANLINQRKIFLGQYLLTTLSPGDRVRFNNRTRPKYLRGCIGTVVRTESGKAIVQIAFGIGKYRAGSQIGTPATLLERAPENGTH